MKLLDELYNHYEEHNYVEMRKVAARLLEVLNSRVHTMELCRSKIKEDEQRKVLAYKVLIESSQSMDLEEVEIRLNEIKQCEERIKEHKKYIDGLE